MNPFQLFVRSRKFWLLVLDTVISLALFFVGKYGGPSAMEDVRFVILTLQPVIIALILSIAYEDGARNRLTAGGATVNVNTGPAAEAGTAPVE